MEKYVNHNSVYVKNGTQEHMILRYLEECGSITNYEAIKELGITQCPARINGLKKRGIKIKDEWITVQNRYGDNVKVKKYYIEKEIEKAL